MQASTAKGNEISPSYDLWFSVPPLHAPPNPLSYSLEKRGELCLLHKCIYMRLERDALVFASGDDVYICTEVSLTLIH